MAVWGSLGNTILGRHRQPIQRQKRPLSRCHALLCVEPLESRLCLSRFLYISSFGTNTIERYQEIRYAPAPADGQTGATFVAQDSGGVNHPLGVIIGPRDHDLYVTSLETNEVLRYHGTTGEFL